MTEFFRIEGGFRPLADRGFEARAAELFGVMLREADAHEAQAAEDAREQIFDRAGSKTLLRALEGAARCIVKKPSPELMKAIEQLVADPRAHAAPHPDSKHALAEVFYWDAFAGLLHAHGWCAWIDWREDPESLAAALCKLAAKHGVARVSGPAVRAKESTSAAYAAWQKALAKVGLTAAILDLKGDTFPVILVPAPALPRLQTHAKKAGYAIRLEPGFSG